MKARIFKPTKTAMQSGKAKTREWALEYEHDGSRTLEPLMGWTSSSDMNQEILLHFSSKEAAIRFAKQNNIDYEVYEPELKNLTIKSYADNFK
jgi:hypothetical protein